MAEKIQLTPPTGAVMTYGAYCALCGVSQDFGIDKEKAEFRIALHNKMEHGVSQNDSTDI